MARRGAPGGGVPPVCHRSESVVFHRAGQPDAGNLFVANTGTNRIRRADATTGTIATVAGTGAVGPVGDGGSALDARFDFPQRIAIDWVATSSSPIPTRTASGALPVRRP